MSDFLSWLEENRHFLVNDSPGSSVIIVVHVSFLHLPLPRLFYSSFLFLLVLVPGFRLTEFFPEKTVVFQGYTLVNFMSLQNFQKRKEN